MNRIKLFATQARKVCEEVSQKVKKYEGRMVTRLDRWNAAAELYSGHTSTKMVRLVLFLRRDKI